MAVIVKMQLGKPRNSAAAEVPGAICFDRGGTVLFGWELTEPELLAQFEGRDFAFFEVVSDNERWKVVRRIEDQDW